MNPMIFVAFLPMVFSIGQPSEMAAYVPPDTNQMQGFNEKICASCLVRQDQPQLFSVWDYDLMVAVQDSDYIITTSSEGYQRIYRHAKGDLSLGKITDIWILYPNCWRGNGAWMLRFEMIADGFKD